MEILVVKYSRRKLIIALMVSGSFIVSSVVMILFPRIGLMRPLITAIIFAAVFITTFAKLSNRTPILIVTDEGVITKDGRILWPDIASLKSAYKHKLVFLLRTTKSKKTVMKTIALGAGDADFNEVFEVINRQLLIRNGGC